MARSSALLLLATLASTASADGYWDYWMRWFRMEQQNTQLQQELALIKSTTGENLTERLLSIEASIAALQATQQRALATIADSVNKHGVALENVNVNSLIANVTAPPSAGRRLSDAAPMHKLNGLKTITITKDSGIQVTFKTMGWTKYDDSTVVIHGEMGRNLIYKPGFEPYLEEPHNRVADSATSGASGGASGRRLQASVDVGAEASLSSVVESADVVEDSGRRLQWGWWGSSDSPPPPSPSPPPPGAVAPSPPTTTESTSTSELCSDQQASLCRECVNNADPWCGQNSWDSNCKAVCTGKTQWSSKGCSAECSESISDVTGEVDNQTPINPPVDCALSAWGAPGACQFKSGSSQCYAEVKRTVTTHPVGGAACGALVKNDVCTCPAVCGDGNVAGGEACDDGNSISGDGCSATCTVEAGWSCTTFGTPAKSACIASACGDGVRVAGEQCDDGNTNDYDGCSSSCTTENYFHCDVPLGATSSCECMRVRKDWNDLRDDERTTYLAAVNALKASGVYDHFVTTHAYEPNKDYAHGTSGFLPWHRKYLLEYENALRGQSSAYKCVTVPYWDWAEETLKCEADAGCTAFNSKSLILNAFGGPGDDECMTSPHAGTVPSNAKSTAKACAGKTTWGSTGAGAKGSIPANAVGCITTGPFANWMTPEYPATKDTTGTCLSRGINWDISSQGYLTGPLRLQEIITSNAGYGSTGGFRAYLESTPHANPHNLLGGHIRSFSSPADPLFWSHHAFIDKVWDMWQNCHNHDEKATIVGDTSAYQATGQNDGVSDNMPFGFPPANTPTTPTGCAKSDSTCATCVHANDGWCASNPWDDVCREFCSGQCSSACGSSSAAAQAPASFIPTWDPTTLKPSDFNSIHALGANNSYLYAPDELDARLKASASICSFVETMHHGQTWKSRRRLSRVDEAKVVPTAPDRRQMQSVASAPPCSSYSAAEAMCDNSCSHASDGYCDDGGFGAEYSACSAGTDCTDCGYTCVCSAGLMWNADYSGCVSIHWQHTPSDADTVAASDYFGGYQNQLMASSIYVKPHDKAADVAKQMTRRECELLYNSKNSLVRVDTCQVQDSFLNRFLRGWNLTASVALGVANDPCNGVVGR